MTELFAILIEDEQAVRLATAQTLELGGFEVMAFASAELAESSISADYAGIIVTDVRLPGKSGLEVLEKVRAIDSELPVIIITGHGDVSMAVEAMRHGAYDFLEKPFAADRLLDACLRAQEKRRLVMENRKLKMSWLHHAATPDLIGQSQPIERVRKFIQSIGPTQADVLINGATGSGKEVVARQLHLASGRRGEFVAINCGALPESVFESEIFGHEAGAFTSAQKRRIGKLEYAQGGTVFLDEIESMPLNLQIKLLRVLQERCLERLGGNQSIALDCRIIAASKADLLKLSAQGQFREDLYYRLSVVNINLPRLNDRREDIPLLLSYFVQRAALRYQKQVVSWTAAQMQHWMQRDWQGNVRQLRNFADQLVLGVAEFADNPAGQDQPSTAGGNVSLPEKIDAYEVSLIQAALEKHANNVAAAADALGIPKKTLYDKMKKYQKSLSLINPTNG
ncbi:sigma-54 dependent transcriptional regulator [Undibacterium sp. TS12]|uniref:sigma-54-dependent transcriptional regulator n=1 Tax=Undibacterium sp. TS12 TaxID=2908202 RepID=UPI001F4CA478|nr:sigma-54 dependent transcriptional regulator [Undibacterium sp. TS12]MCH8620159.1 sigma-54 dependent transcriptional regulator [Undibacterium sp. TS12]